MTALRVNDAVVKYGTVTAVDEVSLEVAPGEILALLGASGSGKSSLLRAIAGLEPLVSGSISWNGAALTHVPVHERGFVVMFQDGQLFPHLDVAQNIAYGLAKWPKADREPRVHELLEMVDLVGYEHRRVTALSGGQAQRVALARSLAPRPRLLLLDEPLSALDRSLREHLVAELGRILRNSSTPALYVTHDQDEAFTIADRVAILENGKLLQSGSPLQLLLKPASAQVTQFLGQDWATQRGKF